MTKLLYSFICFGLLISTSACLNHKRADADTIGQYVFCDDNMVIHCDPECENLLQGKDEHGHDIYSKEYLDTMSFISPDCFRVCSRCVSDKEYEHLMAISNRNKTNKVMPGVVTEIVSDEAVPDEATIDE